VLRTTLIAASAVLTLSLSACGGDDSPEKKEPSLTAPKAGQCIAKEVPDGKDVAPDTETVVPCDQNHTYEIVAAVKIPQKLLAGKTTKAKLARRTQLADIDNDKSKLRQELFKTTYDKCEKPFRQASGLDKLTVMGKSAEKAGLSVSAHVSEWYTISSPKLWLQGKAFMVCSFRYEASSDTKGRAKLSSVRSTSAKPVMASYLTKKFPISARACTESNSSSSVDCARPHNQERLFVIDMKAVYGKKFLSGADLKNVNADELGKIRAACNDPYTQAGGKISEARPMGFRFYSEIPTKGSYLPIICTLNSSSGSLGTTFTAF
jgi:hypothetical protein